MSAERLARLRRQWGELVGPVRTARRRGFRAGRSTVVAVLAPWFGPVFSGQLLLGHASAARGSDADLRGRRLPASQAIFAPTAGVGNNDSGADSGAPTARP